MSRELVDAMMAVADFTPSRSVFYATSHCLVKMAHPTPADPQAYLQWAYHESPRHSYYGDDQWMVRSEIKRGDYDAWPNPWTTPENQEKRG